RSPYGGVCIEAHVCLTRSPPRVVPCTSRDVSSSHRRIGTQEDLPMADLLSLERIRTEGTQVRMALSETVIREYAEAIEQGDEFPPIDVYYDETAHWLADGFHRMQAAKQAGRDTIAAIVHQGGQREALLHALGANDTHGHRRTDADRRHAIRLMLAAPEWQAWDHKVDCR